MDLVALSILREHHYDVWNLAGPNNSGERQRLAFALTGQKLPKSQCGVNALWGWMKIILQPHPGCQKAQEMEMSEKMENLWQAIHHAQN